MKCTNCGKEVPDSAKVCGYCGTKLEKPLVKQPKTVVKPPHEDILSKVKKTPIWVWGLAVIAIVALSVVLLITIIGKGESYNQEVAENAQTPSEISADEETESESPEEVTYHAVHWACEDEFVPADKTLSLWYAWKAVTEEQIEDYFNVIDHIIYVDGEEVPILDQGFGDFSDVDGEYFDQIYWMNIGYLQPGEHEIMTITEIHEKVFDGWDWFGPGTETPTLSLGCTVIVVDD